MSRFPAIQMLLLSAVSLMNAPMQVDWFRFGFASLRNHRLLCVSAVNVGANTLTAETQSTPS